MTEIYKKIPTTADNHCPLCHNFCKTYKHINVLFYDTNRKSIIRNIELLECPHCKIYFANKKIFNQYFSKQNKQSPIFFKPDKMNKTELLNKASSSPSIFNTTKNIKTSQKFQHQEKNNYLDLKQEVLTPIRSINIYSAIKTIYITHFDRRCIICKGYISDFVNFIPVNDTNCVKIKGKYCSHCDKFFYKDLSHIKNLLNGNRSATSYELNLDYYIDPSLKNQNRKIQSAIYLFYLKELDTNIARKIIIVTNKKSENKSADIYHYSDIFARILLANVFHLNKTIVNINDKNYRVLISKHINYYLCKNHIINILNIGKNGGLYSFEENCEIVDVLLYSPYTNRYEIIKATYDKDDEYYYIDISLFKRFIERYGNPGIPINILNNKGFSGFGNLNDESILHAFGYTVSQNESLSEAKRQKIIADVLDLGLMTPKEVISLLEFFINSHKSEKFRYAKLKWSNDIEFVTHYKTNPQRFIIANI